jgi:DNA-binding response OmpR family regulator
MATILLLEDDEILSETLLDLLELHNYQVTIANNGEEALEITFNHTFDLFLFDVNTPKLNGFDLLKALRDADIKTPAIFITSLNDIASLSKGFEVGADDYLKKPFDFNELLVRIKALISKTYHSTSDKIEYKDFFFDINNEILEQNGTPIKLTKSEKKLLKIFLKSINHTIQKELIFNEFENLSDGSLRVHLSSLRKIGFDIISEKSIGYRLAK